MALPDETTAPNILEEHFQDIGTDVEVEQLPDDAELSSGKPWNPDDIRVSTKQFSLRNVMDMIEDGSLELAPEFQRNRVWKVPQKSRLIESVLLQIPLPAFYFAEDADGLLRVVDGLQRLSTINAFVRGGEDTGFALKGLEYLTEEGKRFSDLGTALQRRINNAQIVVHVIDPTTPREVTYDIFKRINTGGTPLNAQEIRHSMSKDRSRDILRDLAATEEFNAATNNLYNQVRMTDREMALRFCAFWIFGVDEYLKLRAMEPFLERTTAALDDPAEVPDDKVADLRAAFTRAMHNSYLVFGKHAFRKWPYGTESLNPVNRALFEAWSISLTDFGPDDLTRRRELIVAEARRLMTDDVTYLYAITASTGDAQRVRYRFSTTRDAARAGL
ncbi:DUF262 domain-containing protein [Streptomonospora litoralis]|uniref:GmrSD restriction endonucleases N-terminal domain-containing protein n=1 Tax=Streptomonospora litoralis TaxID=2498135 RepID=A0A4P6Q7T8_9ACTN|nr:DUF262 domain-containing protein [Streptomonospora litoralis]QBI56460.1 hypothetical protein EKD16_23565 [Streptomonospora litoralis]